MGFIELPDELDGVIAKSTRARELFAQLRTILDDTFQKHSFTTHIQVERAENGLYDAYIIIKSLPAIPPTVGLLVGEILYHYRSALDYIAWQLVLANGCTPGTGTYFPICLSEADFDRDKTKLKGVSSDAKLAIRELQPFNSSDPASHALYALHKLNVEDKHRFTHFVRAPDISGFSIDDGRGQPVPDGLRFIEIEPLIPSASGLENVPIARVQYESLDDIHLPGGTVTCNICFPPGSFRAGKKLLQELLRFDVAMGEVLRRIGGVFPSQS